MPTERGAGQRTPLLEVLRDSEAKRLDAVYDRITYRMPAAKAAVLLRKGWDGHEPVTVDVLQLAFVCMSMAPQPLRQLGPDCARITSNPLWTTGNAGRNLLRTDTTHPRERRRRSSSDKLLHLLEAPLDVNRKKIVPVTNAVT